MEADGKLRALRSGVGAFGAIRPVQGARSRPSAGALVAMARGCCVALCSPCCFRAFATLAVVVGVSGQVVDVLYRSNGRALRGLHAAFGLILLLTLSSRVFQVNVGDAGSDSIDAYRSQRTLKRLVFLLLYLLALVKESLVVGSYLWRGGVITLGSIVIGRHTTDTTVGMDMSDGFGIYLIYAVAAIVFIPMASALRSRLAGA